MRLNTDDPFTVGDWLVEPSLDRITRGTERSSLRPQLMDLLTYLSVHQGRVVSAEELLDNVWRGKIVTSGTVYNCIGELRHSLGKLNDQRHYIETIPKKGYRLVAPVVQPPSPSSTGRDDRTSIAPSEVRARHPVRNFAIVACVLFAGAIIIFSIAVHDPDHSKSESNHAKEPVQRFSIELPDQLLIADPVYRLDPLYRPVEISPDGRHIVFTGIVDKASQLFSRRVDSLDVSPIAGTKNAGIFAFSPDGAWIAFVDRSRGQLKKIPVEGGIPITLCDTGGRLWGLAWGSGGNVVFETAGYIGLMQVPASGGKPTPLTTPKNGTAHKQPSFMPDGEVLVFSIGERGSTIRMTDTVAALSLKSGKQKTLLTGSSPKVTEDGLLVYYWEQAIWAVAFDSDQLAIVGEPVPILNGVHYETTAHFSLSNTGSLIYVVDAHLSRRKLAWIDRSGNEELLPFEPRPYIMPRVAPDGQRIAVVIDSPAGADLWIYSTDGATQIRLTNDQSRETNPVWSSDGKYLYFSSDRVDNLYRVSTDGIEAPEQLTNTTTYQFPQAITADDGALIFDEGPTNARPTDVKLLRLSDEVIAESVLASEYDEFDSALSPDGLWLAYSSNQSGKAEVYVRPFPDTSASVWQISVGGGTQPVWSSDGSRVYYWGKTEIMSVEIENYAEFRAGSPEPVIGHRDTLSYFDLRNFDIDPVTDRLLVVQESADYGAPFNRLVFVQNWMALIADKIAIH